MLTLSGFHNLNFIMLYFLTLSKEALKSDLRRSSTVRFDAGNLDYLEFTPEINTPVCTKLKLTYIIKL